MWPAAHSGLSPGRPCPGVKSWPWREMGLWGVSRAEVHLSLDQVAQVAGALVACWMSGRSWRPWTCPPCLLSCTSHLLSDPQRYPLSSSHSNFAYSHCSRLFEFTQPCCWSTAVLCLLSSISYILPHWFFCLFSFSIVYEIQIDTFSSSSFTFTAI